MIDAEGSFKDRLQELQTGTEGEARIGSVLTGARAGASGNYVTRLPSLLVHDEMVSREWTRLKVPGFSWRLASTTTQVPWTLISTNCSSTARSVM